MPYVEHLCRAMDEQHYSHYDLHRDLWNGSLYCFLRKEYRRLFEQIAAAPFPPRIELHYVGSWKKRGSRSPRRWRERPMKAKDGPAANFTVSYGNLSARRCGTMTPGVRIAQGRRVMERRFQARLDELLDDAEVRPSLL